VENFVSPDKAELLENAKFERRALAGFVPSALVVPRAEWERVGPFATGHPLTDWVDWYLRLVNGGTGISVVDRVLVRRRIHGDNQTMRETHALASYVRLVKASIDQRRGNASERVAWR
jgi:hypothetical protein